MSTRALEAHPPEAARRGPDRLGRGPDRWVGRADEHRDVGASAAWPIGAYGRNPNATKRVDPYE